MNTMYFHAAGPIDWTWGNLPTLREWVKFKVERSPKEQYPLAEDEITAINEVWYSINNTVNDLKLALRIAKHTKYNIGWDGDFSQEPRIMFLPNNNYCDFVAAFVWKHLNNGSVFIASPLEIPESWTGGHTVTEVDIHEAEEFFKLEDIKRYRENKKRLKNCKQ